MGERTEIEWTNTVHADGTVTKGATWNPVVGCSQISTGCRFCYAETLDKRWRQTQEGQAYKPWTHPNANYNVRTFHERLNLPLRWKKPRRIFVNSRSDMFHEAIPPPFREKMWDVMRRANQHIFQILTKRPENILGMLPADWDSRDHEGYPNVWLGVSGETLGWAKNRGKILKEVPARIRFLSAEPWLEKWEGTHAEDYLSVADLFDWVIIGGESGPGCRPMDIRTASALKNAAVLSDVPVFFKQIGGHPRKRDHEEAILDGKRWTEMPNVGDGDIG